MPSKDLPFSRFLALCLLLFFGTLTLLSFHSGNGSLWDIDEPNNAQALKEMVAGHNFIVPYFNDALRSAKPILNYWLMWAGVQLFGMNSWGLRMGSVFTGAAFVLYLSLSTRRLVGARAALLSGLIAATILHTQIIFRAAVPDPLLIFFVTMSLVGYLRAYQIPTSRVLNLLVSYAAMGFATLDEGPIGFLVPGLIIVIFLLLRNDLPFLWREGRLQWGLPLFLLIAMPWYVAVGVETHWQWDNAFLLHENIGRYNAAMQGHKGPFYYYLLTIPLALLPWSVFLPQAIRALWLKRRYLLADYPVETFLMVWAVVWVVFFSLSSTKLPNYVWEAYPPLFIFLGLRFRDALAGSSVFSRRGLQFSLLALFLMGCALFITGALVIPRKIPALGSLYYLGLPYAIAALIGVRWTRRVRLHPIVMMLTASSVALTFCLMAYTEPALNRLKPSFFMGKKIQQMEQGRPYSIATWRWFQPNFLFYAGRGSMPVHQPQTISGLMRLLKSNQGPLYVATPSRDMPHLLACLPHSVSYRLIMVRYELYNHENLALLRLSLQNSRTSAQLQGYPRQGFA